MIRFLKKNILDSVKLLGLRSVLFNTPNQYISTEQWISENKNIPGVCFYPLFEKEEIREVPPHVIGNKISKRFTKFYERSTRNAFVLCIPSGRVLGEDCNLIITPDYKILSDVSREFGAEGGRQVKDFSVFNSNRKIPSMQILKGKIAVLSTCGSSNFHHWNFDVLPRLLLLKEAGVFDEIDYFLVNYAGLSFQKEGLRRLFLDESKIINTNGKKDFYIESEKLFVPSLPEDLGTITPWVINFLRDTFLDSGRIPDQRFDKLFVSRKKVNTRKIINEKEVLTELKENGYKEFIPDDYTMSETAIYFAHASSIVAVHGSALSNLAFISANTKVLDILAPYHQDAYYWMICNQRRSRYIALFAEGDHPDDDYDLVKGKIDNDLLIDIKKFKQALEELE